MGTKSCTCKSVNKILTKKKGKVTLTGCVYLDIVFKFVIVVIHVVVESVKVNLSIVIGSGFLPGPKFVVPTSEGLSLPNNDPIIHNKRW